MYFGFNLSHILKLISIWKVNEGHLSNLKKMEMEIYIVTYVRSNITK